MLLPFGVVIPEWEVREMEEDKESNPMPTDDGCAAIRGQKE